MYSVTADPQPAVSGRKRSYSRQILNPILAQHVGIRYRLLDVSVFLCGLFEIPFERTWIVIRGHCPALFKQARSWNYSPGRAVKSDYLRPSYRWSVPHIALTWVLGIVLLWRLLVFALSLRKLIEMKAFYEHLLNVPNVSL